LRPATACKTGCATPTGAHSTFKEQSRLARRLCLCGSSRKPAQSGAGAGRRRLAFESRKVEHQLGQYIAQPGILSFQYTDFVGAPAHNEDAYEQAGGNKDRDRFDRTGADENFEHGTSPFQQTADGGTMSFWIGVKSEFLSQLTLR
jgi:hypothetical protein